MNIFSLSPCRQYSFAKDSLELVVSTGFSVDSSQSLRVSFALFSDSLCTVFFCIPDYRAPLLANTRAKMVYSLFFRDYLYPVMVFKNNFLLFRLGLIYEQN